MAVVPVIMVMVPVASSDADIHARSVAMHMTVTTAVQMAAMTPAPTSHLLNSRRIRFHIRSDEAA
jgi:hypothetical protein